MLPKVNKNKMTVEMLIGKLFQSRDIIHLRHLKPSNPGQLGSGWEHAALNNFYDSIVDKIDLFVESYQGKYGLLTLDIQASKPIDPTTFLRELAYIVDNEAKDIVKDTWLLNQLDEMTTLIYKTLYKLQNLK